MATPWLKNPCLWGHEIYNFGKPFQSIHNYAIMPHRIQEDLKEIAKNPCP